MIREARPCHLYFDLEFVPSVNAGVQGDALADALLRLVAAELRCVIGFPFQTESKICVPCAPCLVGERAACQVAMTTWRPICTSSC